MCKFQGGGRGQKRAEVHISGISVHNLQKGPIILYVLQVSSHSNQTQPQNKTTGSSEGKRLWIQLS